MTVLPVNDILGPVDGKIHSDDWPIHHLKKVNVVSQQTQQCVSLLESHRNHAVQVTGVIQSIDPSHACTVLDRRWRSQRIEINNVSFWAFSQEEDKSVSLWASSSAGWFELHDPLPQYRDTFVGMHEAVSMLYYLADKWRRSRKGYAYMKTKELDNYVKSVFRDVSPPYFISCAWSNVDGAFQYSKSGRNYKPCSDPETFIHRFHSHARFLITSMLEGQDNLDWRKSPFLRYFQLFVQVRRSHPFNGSYACSTTSHIHDEAAPRLLPQRESKRNKVKEPVIIATKKPMTTSVPHPSSTQHGHMHARGTRNCGSRGETPHPPSKKLGDTDTSSDEEYDSDGRLIKAGTKRKSKSILRPKGSKFSKKGSGRRQSLPPISDSGEEVDSDTEAEAGLPEPSPLAAVASREAPREVKRGSLQHLPRELPPDSAYPYYLPRKVAEVKIVSYDIPSDQAQGPGDLWTCALDDCNHRVHEASKAKGRTQIKEHFQDHARQAQEKIDLALSEARPYLPVSNLVRRIQQVQSKLSSHPAPITHRC
ncbi:MAG: hypothetical protein Q9184_006412 [Pyrenodesmia sp. 2 TL-2023]